MVLLFATSRHKICAYLNLAEGLFNLLLSILLVKSYGLIGVALGTLIPMTIIRVIIQPVYFCRLTSIKYTEYSYKVYKTVAIVCLALIIPAFISLRYATADFVVLFSLGGISFIIYMVAIIFFVFDSSEIQIMRDAFLSRWYKKKSASA
jgi:O-antigen/teichoic acid export membrane protein